METISDLKAICQKKKTQYYTSPWVSRYLHRAVSIYLTKILLTLNVSANQATLASFIFGMIGSTLLIFTQPIVWVVSAFVLYIHVLLDHSDGEIARYRKSSSPAGRYYDEISGMIVRQYFYACISIGVYRLLSYDNILIIGLIVLIFSSVFYLTNKLSSQILYESKDLEVSDSGKGGKTSVIHLLMELGKNIFALGYLGFLWVALAAVIDSFVLPRVVQIASLGPILLDSRSVLFYLFSLGLFINSFSGIILKGREIARTFHKINIT